jgi:hypothetical protein
MFRSVALRIGLMAAALGTAWCCAVSARAVITLDADFDSGSLDESNSFAVGDFVTLAGRDNYNTGSWKWLYFQAAGVNGQQVTFQIDDGFSSGGAALNAHDMVYSYDQETWHFFDNNVRNAPADTYTFSNNSPFTQDQVYVAYGLPYPHQRIVDHTAQMATSPFVSPNLSGGGDLVIGQSPGGIDDLGRVIAPRDMYSYKLTDPSQAGPKKKIVLLGGVHAQETLGNHTLEGLLNFLASDDLEAGILRREAEFFVYPMANPDGRFAGYNRSTVQVPDEDPNRFWDSPDYGGLSDIDLVGTAMRADTGFNIDYLIDFHSDVTSKSGHYGYVWGPWQEDPFWLTFTGLEPEVITNTATLVDLTAAKFGRDELGAEFSITFETEFIAGQNIDRFHDLGRNMGLAWTQVLHQFGDLNFDDTVNEQDWLTFIAGAEGDLSGMTPIERYASGDLDGDGVNSVLDFGIFVENFELANGGGSFAVMLAGEVPEPGTACLALWGALLASRLIDFKYHDRNAS